MSTKLPDRIWDLIYEETVRRTLKHINRDYYDPFTWEEIDMAQPGRKPRVVEPPEYIDAKNLPKGRGTAWKEPLLAGEKDMAKVDIERARAVLAQGKTEDERDYDESRFRALQTFDEEAYARDEEHVQAINRVDNKADVLEVRFREAVDTFLERALHTEKVAGQLHDESRARLDEQHELIKGILRVQTQILNKLDTNGIPPTRRGFDWSDFVERYTSRKFVLAFLTSAAAIATLFGQTFGNLDPRITMVTAGVATFINGLFIVMEGWKDKAVAQEIVKTEGEVKAAEVRAQGLASSRVITGEHAPR